MIVREVLEQERPKFDAVASHPLQTWAWGDFRQDTGVDVLRLGLFEGQNITKSFQIFTHKVPQLNFLIGYYPRGPQPDDAQIFALKTAAQKYNLVFIKNEPNFYLPADNPGPRLKQSRDFLTQNDHVAGRPMFTKYSFVLDLTPPEDQLFTNLKPKTRYNIRLAQKYGVTVSLDNSDAAFNEYIELWKQTTRRQAFYSHDETYHRKMWQYMSKAKVAHLLKATYQNETLAIWIIFIHNNTLYYPYGSSSRKHKKVMASDLLCWEAIRFGKQAGCNLFDMWGALGPNPSKLNSWYGFHRFKAGFSGTLMEFVGTYDYVVDQNRYKIFTIADKWRWKFLRLRSKLPF